MVKHSFTISFNCTILDRCSEQGCHKRSNARAHQFWESIGDCQIDFGIDDRISQMCATIFDEDYFRLYGSFYKLFSESNSLHLQDSGDSDMSIYVGNLSYEDTQDDLTQTFAEYGKVKRVQLPTDRETGRLRGFAFVEMETDAEESAAIEALDGAEWMGRDLKVNKAKPREEKGSFGGGGGGGGGNRRY